MSGNDRLKMIEEMLEQNPQDSFLQYAAALEHEKANQPLLAIKRIATLLDADPNYLGAYYKLGKLHELTGNEATAIEIYRKGRTLAAAQKDVKTLGELNEALMLLDADDELW